MNKKMLRRYLDISVFSLFLLVLLWAALVLGSFPVRPILADDSLSSQFSIYLPLIVRYLTIVPLN